MTPALVLIAGLAAIFAAVALAVAVGGSMMSERQQVARSLSAIRAIRTTPSAGNQELAKPFSTRVIAPLVAGFSRLGRRFAPGDQVGRVRHQLEVAGNPTGWDVDRVIALKIFGLFAGLTLGLVVPLLFGAGLLTIVGFLVLGGALGYFAPNLAIYQIGYNRTEQMRRELPDALDLLTISVEAGLAFDTALSQVARNTTGPLAKEFFRVLQEMQIGLGRAEALRALGDRTTLAELRGFITAMVQADSFGIPIASVLRVQAREMRIKRSQRAEELAQKVPVKILFPLIFCILPALFVVILGPAALTIFTNFGGGLR